jgi:hypothetical protein
MAKRMKAKTIEVNASHISLISQPDTVVKLILEATAAKGWGVHVAPQPAAAVGTLVPLRLARARGPC